MGIDELKKLLKHISPPKIELGTLRVLGAREDHYTTETGLESNDQK